MKRQAYRLWAILLVTGAAFAAAGVFLARPTHDRLPVTTLPPKADAAKPSPSLRCLFSDFTHTSVVVGFEFAVAFPKSVPPRFVERAEAVRNDPEIVYDAGHQPVWSYAIDDGIPTIASPGGETRIVLYGLKPGLGDPSWFEAGIRSNDFRNLDGKCLQAHFP